MTVVVVALAVLGAVVAICLLAPEARAMAHLLVVLAALGIAVGTRRLAALVSAAAAEVAIVGVVLLGDAGTSAALVAAEAVAAMALAASVVLVVTEHRRRAGRVLDRLHAVDQAVVAFAATCATAATADAVRAGLRVVLPGARLERLQLGPATGPPRDLAGLVLATISSTGERAVLPDGFTRSEDAVLVGFPVPHGTVEAAGVVVRVPATTDDDDLDLVTAFLRRVAPTLAAQTAASAWAAADPTPDRDAELARAAHDLRVPLTSLTGAVETLVQYGEVMEPAQRDQLYGVLTRSTRRVSRWVAALLEDSLTSTAVRAQPRAVALQQLLDEAAEAAASATTGVDVEVARTDLDVEADPGLVIRVLTNLLANAGHHAASGGTVEIAVHERGDDVQVQVVDHGPGIDPGAADALLREDGRGRWLGGAEGVGLGLGLASARNLVSAWGGQFGIGRTPGGGATIWFSLSLAAAEDVDADADADAEQLDAGTDAPDPEQATATAAASEQATANSTASERATAVSGQPLASDGRVARDAQHALAQEGEVLLAEADDDLDEVTDATDLADDSDDSDDGTAPPDGGRVRWTVVGPDPSSLPGFLRSEQGGRRQDRRQDRREERREERREDRREDRR